MSFCINCGKKLEREEKYCANCGKAVNVNGDTQRKTVYDGEIHKCPNCGEILHSFITICPSCGYELRNIKGNSTVSELVKKIEKATSVDEKNELITNFYVPNTREDIYDFFILAVSNLENTNHDTDDAWKSKLEQTYHKAKISFGNMPEFDYIEMQYRKTLDKVSKHEFSNFIRKNKRGSITALLIIGGVFMMVVGIIFMMVGGDNDGIRLGGGMFILLGLNFLITPIWVFSEFKKK
mgnify:CR=1 FL=1